MKILTALLTGAVAMIALTSCSQTRISPEILVPDESSGFTTESEALSFDEASLSETPYVTNVLESSFVLVDGGSSSCPNVINSVVYDSSENKVNVRYEPFPEELACTADYALTSTTVSLHDATIANVETVKFYLEDRPVDVVESFEQV